jgi:hypothetical protein
MASAVNAGTAENAGLCKERINAIDIAKRLASMTYAWTLVTCVIRASFQRRVFPFSFVAIEGEFKGGKMAQLNRAS